LREWLVSHCHPEQVARGCPTADFAGAVTAGIAGAAAHEFGNYAINLIIRGAGFIGS
jgi:hypothetical protein